MEIYFVNIEFDLCDQCEVRKMCLNEGLYFIGHKITLRPKPLHHMGKAHDFKNHVTPAVFSFVVTSPYV